MANGFNRVILVGNLGADPELRHTQASGAAVTSFSIAVNERRKIQGEWQDAVEWFKIVVWGKTAENCCEYLSKGSQIHVEGRLQTRKWQDRDGIDRWSTEVVANTVLFLGSQGGSGGGQRRDEPPPHDDDDVPF